VLLLLLLLRLLKQTFERCGARRIASARALRNEFVRDDRDTFVTKLLDEPIGNLSTWQTFDYRPTQSRRRCFVSRLNRGEEII
jgi:hypothetical protein